MRSQEPLLDRAAAWADPAVAGITKEADAMTDVLRSRQATPVVPLRVDSEGAAPAVGLVAASYAQRQMWYLSRLDSETATYLVPLAYRLHGPLDVAALSAALDTLVARHAALRTTLGPAADATAGESGAAAASDGAAPRLVQVVHDPCPGLLRVHDLSGLPTWQRDQEMQTRIHARARDPDRPGPRTGAAASLLRCAAEEHVLLLTMHHVAVDEWSLGILHDEWERLYTAHRTGRPADLGPVDRRLPRPRGVATRLAQRRGGSRPARTLARPARGRTRRPRTAHPRASAHRAVQRGVHPVVPAGRVHRGR